MAACSAPTAPVGGATAGVGYAGLASGRYNFIAKVRLTNGQLTIARRHFTVAAPQTLFATHADYWENTSGRYLAVRAGKLVLADATLQAIEDLIPLGPAFS